MYYVSAIDSTFMPGCQVRLLGVHFEDWNHHYNLAPKDGGKDYWENIH